MSQLPEDEDAPAELASPPCLIGEVDPVYMGLNMGPDWNTDLAGWRKTQREALIAARMALSQQQRQDMTKIIVEGLDKTVPALGGKTVSLYWPFRGEPDLRDWMDSVNKRGGTCLLPMVIAKGQPLVFRAWRHGEKLDRGVWNIPFPAEGPEVQPDIVIAPLVGYDRLCYRLGYGGGFFDRTIAACEKKPMVIGVGYALQAMETIHPQPYDIPMDFIITQAGVTRRD